MQKYSCWYAHRESYVPRDTMIEMMVGSTSSSSNVYRVVDNNSNPYMNIAIDAMRMNQDYNGQCLIVNKELNANTTRFFNLLKNSDESLWDNCTNHTKLSIVTQMFTIKSYHGLSEASYDIINCHSKLTMRNDVFQLGELINLYRVVLSNDLEENLNFHLMS